MKESDSEKTENKEEIDFSKVSPDDIAKRFLVKYHRTPEEACTAFIEYASRRVETLENDLATTKAALAKVKQMAEG